ncbi:FAR1 DNA binding domain [Dillenia turbinata]|uniref:FAR1 DNA binding domain n=1 Tax=Dillenia turbinata TaxID=194707 RepID=A0AAN8VZ90_9MAGN
MGLILLGCSPIPFVLKYVSLRIIPTEIHTSEKASLSSYLLTDVQKVMGAEAKESSSGRELVQSEEGKNLEPYVGMEFESEEAAKAFYNDYACREGFVMRIDQCRRSEVDRRILSRRLSCNKQGYYVKARDEFGPVRKPRTSTREGCKAMMLVKIDKSGKWIVTRFVKEHTHPLVSGRPACNAMDSKDRKIQELMMELERQDRLCEVYRDQLLTLLKNVEDQTKLLSNKIQVVVNSVKECEEVTKTSTA